MECSTFCKKTSYIYGISDFYEEKWYFIIYYIDLCFILNTIYIEFQLLNS